MLSSMAKQVRMVVLTILVLPVILYSIITWLVAWVFYPWVALLFLLFNGKGMTPKFYYHRLLNNPYFYNN